MAEILLGVSGGIAAYKSIDLMRELQRRGHDVSVVMTASASRFVGTATFAALSDRPVGTTLFGPPDQPGYDHLDFARRAEVMVIAPATANTLARMAGGLAGDLLGSTYLATTCPVVVAPAMNTRMWEHPATVDNVALLRSRGVQVVEPAVGLLADGDVGAGRLAPVEEIADAVVARIDRGASDPRWVGARVMISAGGTREPIDSVRYIGNRSSGRMGVALAAAARDRGARVTLVAANLAVAPPAGVRVVTADTAEALRVACHGAAADADLVIMAAAVADYRPVAPSDAKIDKSASATMDLALERTPDILSELVAARGGRRIVGFAAEHGPDGVDRARAKRARKGVEMIVVNDISQDGIGFDSPQNAVTILGPGDASEVVDRADKRAVAERILDVAAALIDRSA